MEGALPLQEAQLANVNEATQGDADDGMARRDIDNWMHRPKGRAGPPCPDPEKYYFPLSRHAQGRKTSQVYGLDKFRELTPEHPCSGSFTHQCCAVLEDGNICNVMMCVAMTQPKANGMFARPKKTSHLSLHLREHHGIFITSTSADNTMKRAASLMAVNTAVKPQRTLTGSPREGLVPGSFALIVDKDVQMAHQAYWYIYDSGHVSKSTFRSDLFKNMMFKAGAKELISVNMLNLWTGVEFQIFLIIVSIVFEKNWDYTKGNEFTQLLHDDGTLSNSKKYTAIVAQLVDCINGWPNLHVCLAFPQGFEAVKEMIADLMNAGDIMDPAYFLLASKQASERTAQVISSEFSTAIGVGQWEDCHLHESGRVNIRTVDIVSTTGQDCAALAVSQSLMEDALLYDGGDELCSLHQNSKITASCLGDLVRTRNGVAVNPPSKELAEIMKVHRAFGKHFSYGATRISQLNYLQNTFNEPKLKLQGAKNGT